jgi:septal ring factor EnvC (AmiA/AmiB activator)
VVFGKERRVYKNKKEETNSCFSLHTPILKRRGTRFVRLIKKKKKKRERKRENPRNEVEAFRVIALFDDDDAPRKRSSDDCAEKRKKRKKKKKKKRDLNYFPKGFKSENLSETSLFSISRGKVTLRDIKPHEGVHFGRLDARESLREIRNIARR